MCFVIKDGVYRVPLQTWSRKVPTSYDCQVNTKSPLPPVRSVKVDREVQVGRGRMTRSPPVGDPRDSSPQGTGCQK